MARLLGLLICVAACGNISRKQDDAGVRDDAQTSDADTQPPGDAGTDAMMVLPPTEARDVIPGGVRMTGGGYTFDVQLGHGTQQNKVTGGGYTLEGNAAVKP